ncbi:MAG TPA: response regulator [Phycisphaerales bacterium]|nr:response regulator [Phycisphaerales bacterium]
MSDSLGAAVEGGAGGIDASIEVGSASILVVDDHEQNLELLQAYLDEIGCEVRTARDGLEALAEIHAKMPDLILLDVMMPRMSGFQLCTKLKGDPATRDIPIVMVTALSEVGDVERAVESGADDFLTKPLHKVELLTRARSLLRYRLLKKRYEAALDQVKKLTRGE